MPVPLHTHSWYSLLEGVSSLEQLLERARACGYKALALTDTNNLYGAVPFVELACRLGVRPLLGACLRQQRTRCVALIAERAGYRNLCRILSRLHLEQRPLTDLLPENAEGLHVLVDDAALAERLREAFGARLWLEVTRPPRSRRQEQELLDAAERLGARLVASTAAHFTAPEEYPVYRLLTAVRQGTLLDQLPVELPLTPHHYLAGPEELRRRFRDLPQAVHNTDLLAEQLRSDVLPRDTILPQPRLPRQFNPSQYLRLLCERGLRRRDLGESLAARERLREELAVIESGALAGYFLVVRDIARFARRRRHGMALRGSAGNSLVCYLLEITDVDPLRFNLSLERFLHAGRPDLPDIDLDFDWKVRDEVIAYVMRRHGLRHTAMISSHLFLQPRSAFREAGKVHGLSNEQISRLLEILPERVEKLLRIEDRGSRIEKDNEGAKSLDPRSSILDPQSSILDPRSSAFPLEPARWPRLLRDARLLLGRPHHLSIHPGGVVITPRPLEEYVPLQMAPKGVPITQFEKDAAGHIGLVKIDLLGNRALAAVDEAQRLVVASGQLLPHDLHRCLEEDGQTLELVQRGDTLGVNQLESPAMRHLLVQMQPRCIDDVIQTLALVRPGAAAVGMKERFLRRRRGLEPLGDLDPRLEMLQPTQGLMLYEDDALHVIRALTGWDVPEAYRFYKQIARDETGEHAAELSVPFLEACSAQNVPGALAAEQWVQLTKFRHYTFCKSHAVSYGLLAWLGAYFKRHHPLCFWTAVLNNNQGSYPRRVYVEAIKRAGIELRLPCVNRSAGPFAIEGDTIRVGLDAVANLSQELKIAILTERRRHGPYRDLADFRRRVTPGPEALATLIRCGALDFTGRTRPALLLEADLFEKEKGKRQKAKGSLDEPALFPFALELFTSEGWSPPDYSAEQRLRDEWDLLGFVLGPPLMALFRPQLPSGLITSPEIPAHLGRMVSLAGMTATARQARTADGRDLQFLTLQDEWGLVEVTLFAGMCPQLIALGLGPYLATGRVEDHLGVLALNARSVGRWKGIV